MINGSPVNSTLELYDVSGKLIERRIIESGDASVNLPHSKQIYIVKLLSSSGEVIAVKKL